jgi:hypothetical protein
MVHMAEPDDAQLEFWKEHREQLRQSETQRSVLTNFVLVIVAGISGLIVQQHYDLGTLPLSVLIVILGLYGALAAAKYHERANYHLSQARGLTRALVESGALPDNRELLAKYRDDHYAAYPRLSRFRLHWTWTGLHLGIAVYGLVLIIVTSAK